MEHVSRDGARVPCLRVSHGRCRVCELTDRASPYYREDYRRLFHPEEFPESAPKVTPPIQGQPARSIPLAGDVVAALTARVGADRAAEWVASKLGKDCGCAARREKLNRLDQSVRKFLGIGG